MNSFCDRVCCASLDQNTLCCYVYGEVVMSFRSRLLLRSKCYLVDHQGCQLCILGWREILLVYLRITCTYLDSTNSHYGLEKKNASPTYELELMSKILRYSLTSSSWVLYPRNFLIFHFIYLFIFYNIRLTLSQ